MNCFLWMQESYPLCGEELLLFKTSISFIDPLQEFLGALLTTCTLVIPPFNEIKENIFYVHDFLQAYSINRLIAVPSLMRVILPALRSPYNIRVQRSLKTLVLSGEVFPISLWKMLYKLLPNTTILNLYGSTEGLLSTFESEALDSVPLGMPISNCDLVLVGEDSPMQGEIYVGGLCIATGYYCNVAVSSQEFVKSPIYSSSGCFVGDLKFPYYFKTGDFARQLESGHMVFLGRKDRTVKVNGQRIALDEVESTLRRCPGVVDAAVISCRGQEENALLEAHLVMRQKDVCSDILRSSIRSWMLDKFPLAMIPSSFFFSESFPMSSTGKVNHAQLASKSFSAKHDRNEIGKIQSTELLQVVKTAFCDALMVETVSNDDDFFKMGGNSISAAHVCHSLEMDMRLLYIFPTPMKLQMALIAKEDLCDIDVRTNANLALEESLFSNNKPPSLYTSRARGRLFTHCKKSVDSPGKRQKVDSDFYRNSRRISLGDGCPWECDSFHVPCSFSRCNKVICQGAREGTGLCHKTIEVEIPRNKRVAMIEVWKVHMESCVDASPLLVLKGQDTFVLIGSHSFKFLCINAKSGLVLWETQLEGRTECSAAILEDFSQVVVGCYEGNIYFIDLVGCYEGNIYFIDLFGGNICWHFQTCSEVKCQPVVDKHRNLVRCGSHDRNLYALDYRSYCCVYKLSCSGSVYTSPVIDEVHDVLYVASTGGRVTEISVRAMPFSELWLHKLEAPVFGSLSINSEEGNVLCRLVDGHVVALDAGGSIIWKVTNSTN